MARVLLVFEPPDGGVAENVMQLALRLGAHGHAVEVAGPRESTVYPRLRAAGVTVHDAGLRRGFGRPQADLQALRHLLRLLRTGGFAAVHCHSAKAGVLGRVAGRLAGVPAVYSPHCFGFVGDVGPGRRWFSSVVEFLLGHTCTAAIVCACEAERRRALSRRLAPQRRLRRVYYGVEDCPGDREVNAALLSMRAAGPLAGAVSVLREQKRLDVLIDAAPLVFARVADARIAIVGDGEERTALERRMAAAGLDADERFALLPFSAPSSRHLLALDVYVLPSAWEAMPIGALEALACGVPQVATNVEGTGEAVGVDTGILVSPGDARALADAIVDLLSDPQRRAAMSAASRARHAERFTVERMVAQTAAVYDEVLAR